MIRWQVREALAERIAAHPDAATVKVTARYPGDKHQTSEMIFGDRTEGDISFPYGMTGPRINRDTFTVTLVARVAGVPGDDGAARVEELARLIVEVVATTPDLDGFEVDGEQVSEVGPLSVSTREGETREGGPLALAEVTVSIETQTVNLPEDT